MRISGSGRPISLECLTVGLRTGCRARRLWLNGRGGATERECIDVRGAAECCSTIWDSLHGHPLLRELADGTLPLETFRFFLEQTTSSLRTTRGASRWRAKSRNAVELRSFTADFNAVLESELPSNRDLLATVEKMRAADQGGSLAMAPANVAYTSYLRSVALRGGTLEILAALLPCAWSYVEIAQRLRDETISEHPVYAGWIAFLSAPHNVESHWRWCCTCSARSVGPCTRS